MHTLVRILVHGCFVPTRKPAMAAALGTAATAAAIADGDLSQAGPLYNPSCC